MNRRCFLLIALALAGCHSAPVPSTSASTPSNPGADSTTAPQSSQQPQEPTGPSEPESEAASRPIIVAFGDSLTAGYGADPGQSYPDFLQQDLDTEGYHYRVINAGVSGNTTKDGVERLKDVLALKPAIVIVEFGGNDGLRGLPNAQTRANLDRIVGALTRAHIQVLMAGITLPPNYGEDYISQFNQTYPMLAKKYHVPLLPFLLINVYNQLGSMQEDGIHATAQGNRQVARNLLPLLTPMLKKGF